MFQKCLRREETWENCTFGETINMLKIYKLRLDSAFLSENQILMRSDPTIACFRSVFAFHRGVRSITYHTQSYLKVLYFAVYNAPFFA